MSKLIKTLKMVQERKVERPQTVKVEALNPSNFLSAFEAQQTAKLDPIKVDSPNNTAEAVSEKSGYSFNRAMFVLLICIIFISVGVVIGAMKIFSNMNTHLQTSQETVHQLTASFEEQSKEVVALQAELKDVLAKYSQQTNDMNRLSFDLSALYERMGKMDKQNKSLLTQIAELKDLNRKLNQEYLAMSGKFETLKKTAILNEGK